MQEVCRNVGEPKQESKFWFSTQEGLAMSIFRVSGIPEAKESVIQFHDRQRSFAAGVHKWAGYPREYEKITTSPRIDVAEDKIQQYLEKTLVHRLLDQVDRIMLFGLFAAGGEYLFPREDAFRLFRELTGPMRFPIWSLPPERYRVISSLPADSGVQVTEGTKIRIAFNPNICSIHK